MRSILIVFLTFIVASQAVSVVDEIKEEWRAFKLKYKKSYTNEVEEKLRFDIFYEKVLEITKHNVLYKAGKVSYAMGLNEYSDLSHSEFMEKMTGYAYIPEEYLRNHVDQEASIFNALPDAIVPNEIDWRTKGAITPVKNQGACGSCYAFSANGALEAHHFIKTGKLVSLSEQNIVDCTGIYGNGGCHGGWMDLAFQYVKDNGGINTQLSYPYTARVDTCNFTSSSIGATVSSYLYIPQADENKLKEAVGTIGPVSVAINAGSSFQNYQKDIYDEPACNPKRLNHAVVVVGYGTDSNGHEYWLCKNSWGPTWGDNGYIKMSRNKNNQCGIASMAVYPVV